MCDLYVIQILSSGCCLHVHYKAVCFGGVKHTAQQKTINKRVRSDAEKMRVLPRWISCCLIFSGPSVICDVKWQNLIMARDTELKGQSSHSAAIMDFIFRIGLKKSAIASMLLQLDFMHCICA